MALDVFHPPVQGHRAARRCLVGAFILAVVAAGLWVAVRAAATLSVKAGPDRMVFFILPDWQLMLVTHVISGLAGITAVVMLIPLLVRKISRAWLRRLAAVAAALAAVAAAVPWLFYFAGIGLNAASATYTKVTADDGRSVIVGQSGFDRSDYVVYRQESPLLWKRSAAGTSVSDIFNPDACSVTTDVSSTADLQLTCGSDSILVPPLDG